MSTLAKCRDHALLDRAVRAAWRGRGRVDPNPPVGCVISTLDGHILGTGHHASFGERHAERAALHAAGMSACGGSAHVTLEPCRHQGKTPPCTDALIEAGIRRVVIAHADLTPEAAGGADVLTDAGVEVSIVDHEPSRLLLEPFLHHRSTGRPWVTLKWAQTIDGRIATRSGESQWISGRASRRLVHRERGRTDLALVGIGTVLADDPLLTARCVPIRRIARRVIIDPALQTPTASRLVQTARDVPTTICTSREAFEQCADHARVLGDSGVHVLHAEGTMDELPLEPVLEDLSTRYGATTAWVEGGPGLASRLLREGLAQQALVFTAPLLLADEDAPGCLRGQHTASLAEGWPATLLWHSRRGDDLVALYRFPSSEDSISRVIGSESDDG